MDNPNLDGRRMGAKSSIEWTDATWSPIRARVKYGAAKIAAEKGYTSLINIAEKMSGRAGPHCERVSHGCDHCYSDTNNGRCLPANGTGLPFDRRARDLVDIFVDEKILMQPAHWKKARKIFVENQSDLLGEWVEYELIDRVWQAMLDNPQHTYQVLTKRAACLLEYLSEDTVGGRAHHGTPPDWIWLGVSCEDQKTADERIPLLLRTPAAVRFVSYEPALGPIDFNETRDWLTPNTVYRKREMVGCLSHLDWIIVGGESGLGSRPFDIHWARNTVEQCKDANVPCFVKQLGTKPMYRAHGDDNPRHLFNGLQLLHSNGSQLKDRKGGTWEEWPADLRVREFPSVEVTA